MTGKSLDEFMAGEVHLTPTRTITETDVTMFAAMTGDYVELHTSETVAQKTQFGRRIAHGLLLLAISHGLLSRVGLIDGTGIGFAEIENWKFKAPVFFGDTVHVRITVVETRPSKSKPDRGILKLRLEIINQDGNVVQEGVKVLMMQRKPVQ
jgi:acyl dehydratase